MYYILDRVYKPKVYRQGQEQNEGSAPMNETLKYAILRAGLGQAITILRGNEKDLRALWRAKCQGHEVTVVGGKIFIDDKIYTPLQQLP